MFKKLIEKFVSRKLIGAVSSSGVILKVIEGLDPKTQAIVLGTIWTAYIVIQGAIDAIAMWRGVPTTKLPDLPIPKPGAVTGV